MLSYLIREASLDDSDACIKLLKQLGYPLELNEFNAKLELCKIDLNYKIFVMVFNTKVVGLIALTLIHFLHRQGKYAKIAALVVDEETRGHGLGSKLLNHAESYALHLGCDKIELTSGFHRRAGGTYKFYFSHGICR
jgi:N-acetylglutamate synthase and related acetyltransferases